MAPCDACQSAASTGYCPSRRHDSPHHLDSQVWFSVNNAAGNSGHRICSGVSTSAIPHTWLSPAVARKRSSRWRRRMSRERNCACERAECTLRHSLNRESRRRSMSSSLHCSNDKYAHRKRLIATGWAVSRLSCIATRSR